MKFKPECVRVVKYAKIKVEEMDKALILSNSLRKKYSVVRYDGCVESNKTAADWLVIDYESKSLLIIELKGKNVEHALFQISETARRVRAECGQFRSMAGIVVCRQYPHASTKAQRLEEAFTREFRAPLRIATRRLCAEFSSLIG